MGRKIRSLKSKFRKITIIPLVLFGLITLITTSLLIYNSMRQETKEGLHSLSHAFSQICELSGSGDYQLKDNILYRGDQPFDSQDTIVDGIKKNSNVDATIFWGNRRVSTTILNDQNKRANGTVASPKVQQVVLKEGKSYFSDSVTVNGTPYFGQYVALRNADERIVGMLFVGKPRSLVMQTIYRFIAITSSILILMITFVALISLNYSNKIIQALNSMKLFLGRITKGDVDTSLHRDVLERDDEIGEMGRFSVMLQKSVTELINTDALTGLCNRRSCTLFLESAVNDFKEHDIPFTLVIGDIDDFKRINDTYGHSIGDVVLKKVAETFLEQIGRDDFVARWGGEEFLFIYQRRSQEETLAELQRLQKVIRHVICCSTETCEDIKVTMTFGVSAYNGEKSVEEVLKCADEKMYSGKENGKDTIVIYEG